jgi:hypothetical protein
MAEDSLLDRLIGLQVGGCTCPTKSPETSFHKPECTFRIAIEAFDELVRLQEKEVQLHELRQQIEELRPHAKWLHELSSVMLSNGWATWGNTCGQAARAIQALINGRGEQMETEHLSEGLQDVIAERIRQVNEEGWTADHDDGHDTGNLALAAACYALQTTTKHYLASELWPWDFQWWKPKGPRSDLVRAAALIIAEIERLDRLSESENPSVWP